MENKSLLGQIEDSAIIQPPTPDSYPQTPKEKCEAANAGKCGVCNDDGSFTACA